MPQNRILASLSSEEQHRLNLRAEAVAVPRGTIILQASDVIRDVYFPTHGLFSLGATSEEGQGIELAAVGREGLIGLSGLLGGATSAHQVVAQFDSTAQRVPADVLRLEFKRGGALQQEALRYANAIIADISRSFACHRFHSTQQRLSRWLLIARDNTGADSFDLTHDFMSNILGVHRSVVSEAAIELHDAGLIAYRHGRLVVKSPEGLTLTTCDCYEGLRKRRAASISGHRAGPLPSGSRKASVGFPQSGKPADSV